MIWNNNYGSFSNLLTRLISDESGAEIVEVAMVTGLVALICIAAMKTAGANISQLWNNMVISL